MAKNTQSAIGAKNIPPRLHNGIAHANTQPAHSSSDLLSARAIQAKSLLLRSHLFSIETAEQRRFTKASISSQKNATLWSIFAPLQGCRQLKCVSGP